MKNGFHDITVGSYLPHDSLMHKMDPKLKFLLVITLMISSSILQTDYLLLFIGFFSVILGKLGRIPLILLIKSLRPFLFLFLFTFFFHLFFTPGQTISLFFGAIDLTYEGFQQGVIINLRLIILIWLSSIATFTTSPQKLVNTLECFLRPLKVLNFPVKNFSMMILISIKFIPIIFQEINKINFSFQNKNSKNMRWNLHSIFNEIVSKISPILINSFRRADELANEIDSFGFEVIDKL